MFDGSYLESRCNGPVVCVTLTFNVETLALPTNTRNSMLVRGLCSDQASFTDKWVIKLPLVRVMGLIVKTLICNNRKLKEASRRW